MVDYIPHKGDVVVLSFDPQSGHEQKGRRPAVIVSDYVFNKKVGLAFACPITNTDRNFPFHVPIKSKNITGFIMTEQIKSVDFRSRKIYFVEKAKKSVKEEIIAILKAII